MKKNIYIHLGLPKTATTFLQKNVFRYSKDLHYVTKIPFSSETKKKSILISNEAISGSPQAGKTVERRNKIVKTLSQMYPEAGIIIGIRNKQKWIQSLYKQYIKQGGIKKFDDWYDEIFDQRHLDFDGYLSLLESLFPKIYVYQLEDFKKDNEKEIKDLCDFLDIAVPDYDTEPMNVSLDENNIENIRKMNHMFKTSLNPDGVIPSVLKIKPRRIYDTIPHFINQVKGRDMADCRTDISYITKKL